MRYLVALVLMSVIISLVIPAAMIGYGIGKRVLISAWADRQVRKAERIMGLDSHATTHQFAHELTDGEDEYREHHWSEAMDAHCDQSLAIAKHTPDALDKVSPLPGRRLASVPDQGKPSGWS